MTWKTRLCPVARSGRGLLLLGSALAAGPVEGKGSPSGTGRSGGRFVVATYTGNEEQARAARALIRSVRAHGGSRRSRVGRIRNGEEGGGGHVPPTWPKRCGGSVEKTRIVHNPEDVGAGDADDRRPLGPALRRSRGDIRTGGMAARDRIQTGRLPDEMHCRHVAGARDRDVWARPGPGYIPVGPRRPTGQGRGPAGRAPLLVNATDRAGRTPLFAAVSAGNQEMVRLLVDRGALVRVGDQNLRTPIHAANWRGDPAMVDLLLDAGAVVDTRAIAPPHP